MSSNFKIPASVQSALKGKRSKIKGGKNVTWNGTTVWYDVVDRETARDIYQAARDGLISVAQARNEIDVLHALKVELDARAVAFNLPVEDIHRTIQFEEDEWAEMQAEADRANARAQRTRLDNRNWNQNHRFLGIVGEEVFSRITGIPRTKDKLLDGGQDFPGVDTKAVPYFDRPLLMRPVTDRFVADCFVLIAADLLAHRARYIGYATREKFITAPETAYERAGRVPTRELRPGDLHPELPPVA